MSNDLHRYGIMIHKKGTKYEDDPDIYEGLLDGSWWDDMDPEVFVCLYT